MTKLGMVKGGLAVLLLFLVQAVAWGEDAPAAPAPGAVAPSAPAATPTAVPAAAFGWREDMAAQVGLAQSYFSNWSQGGEDSLTWQGLFLGKAANDEAGYTWTTTLKLAFGQIRSGTAEIKKSTDEINLESVATYKLGIQVDPYLAVKGITQFTSGYDYSGPEKVAISNFMDPGYFFQSAGFGYTGLDWFKTRLGFAVRETVTRDFPKYADNPNTAGIETFKVDTGMESVTDVSLKLNDTARFASNLALFSNLKAADQIVVRWDNTLSISLAKYITAGINLQILYDKIVSTSRQLSQAMTLGLAYQFSTQEVRAGK